MEHVHVALAWTGPRAPLPADDAWDIVSSRRGDEWVVELQRRIAIYLPQGEFSDEAIASCALRYRDDARWLGIERLAADGVTATTGTPAEIDEGRRRVEATAAFRVLASAPLESVTLALSDGFPKA